MSIRRARGLFVRRYGKTVTTTVKRCAERWRNLSETIRHTLLIAKVFSGADGRKNGHCLSRLYISERQTVYDARNAYGRTYLPRQKARGRAIHRAYTAKLSCDTFFR